MDNDLRDLFNILLVSTALALTGIGPAFAKGGGGGGGVGRGGGGAASAGRAAAAGGARAAAGARVAAGAKAAAASRTATAAARAANAGGRVAQLRGAAHNAEAMHQAGAAVRMSSSYRFAANDAHFSVATAKPAGVNATAATPKYTFTNNPHLDPSLYPGRLGGGNGGGNGGGKGPPKDPPKYKSRYSGGGGEPPSRVFDEYRPSSYTPSNYYLYYGHGGHSTAPQEKADDAQLQCMKRTLQFSMAVDAKTITENEWQIYSLRRQFDDVRQKGESLNHLDLDFFSQQVLLAYKGCVIDK